ncbi:hypothetical protein L6252_03150 [Candidatus Parcubacteria bacterium]|nr:hypothetical protein [Candidatus Parcubacteria bacterium]
MKWLPFKLTEQEKQALKEAGKGRSFKSFQKEMVVYVVLLVLAVALFWRQYSILTLIVVAMAGVISVRYSASLRVSNVTLSVANKVEAELKKQQESALKFRPKVFLFVVLPLILLLVGVVVYVLYSQSQERKEMIYGLGPVLEAPIVENNANETVDETANWQTYRNEKYSIEMKYPDKWVIQETLFDNEGRKPFQPVILLGNPLEGFATYVLSIFIMENSEQLSLEEYVNNFIEKVTREPIGVLSFEKRINTNIGGLYAIELYNVFAYDQGEEQIFIKMRDKILRFSFPIATENPNLNNPIENNAIVHRILSSFRLFE